MKRGLLLLLLIVLVACNGYAGDKYYVFYLHGRIVELQGLEANSPEHGPYKYKEILKALEDKGYIVLSEMRGKDTEMEPYARKIAAQIDCLKKAGVPADHIALIGASKGAYIGMYVAGIAKDKKLKYVLMGTCLNDAKYPLYGKVLMINERSDSYGKGCQQPDKTNITSYKEVMLNNGLGHGFLYRPLPEWVEPAETWIRK
ncbi:MAG: alpha/beta hydrolase [Sphingobacteriales bacterium]|nr:MAG: alpha/beta hydrolase [Sphingobacteriales bacterium]